MFDLKTWDGFSELKKKDLDYLLDTTALNKKMAVRGNNPYNWRVGSFQVPKGISKEWFEKLTEQATRLFVSSMEKQGWELKSKIQVFGPFPAYDLDTRVILLDKNEIRMRGIFKTNPKPVRYEIPTSAIKGSENTLTKVSRGEGMRPVPRNKRPIK